MKRFLAMLLLLLTLCACNNDKTGAWPIVNDSQTESGIVASDSNTGQEEISLEKEDDKVYILPPYPPYKGIKKVPLEDIRENWAWAIGEMNDEVEYGEPGTQLTAESYASPDRWDALTLAVSPNGLATVRYAGEKKATDHHSMGDGYYYPFFEDISGPVWTVTENSQPMEYSSIILLPASCRNGILTLASVKADYNEDDGFDNHGYPPAIAEDIKRVGNLHKDRQIIHSELLSLDSNGGRVSLFQFNNAENGLLVLAYIQEDRMITLEFTAHIYDGKAVWRADAEDDNICFFEVNMLCETDKGLVIGFSWYGPEGCGQYLLLENDGRFIDFITGGWYYGWEDEFFGT